MGLSGPQFPSLHSEKGADWIISTANRLYDHLILRNSCENCGGTHSFCTFWDLPTNPAIAAGTGAWFLQLLERLSPGPKLGAQDIVSQDSPHPLFTFPHGSSSHIPGTFHQLGMSPTRRGVSEPLPLSWPQAW